VRKLRQLKQKEIKSLKIHLHKKQKRICPILGTKFKASKMVLDHQHKTKKEKIGKNGAGLARGAIHFQANVLEGKITNAFKRYGLAKFGITLPDFLRNLADYLERENLPYIHPNEKPPKKKLMKRSYNKLRKLYDKKPIKSKFPDFPKSGKLIKPLEKLYNHYGLQPEFYGNKK
jgi:hypothetical protein